MELAAIIVAVLVPVLTAFVAHNLIVQKEKKDRVMDLFFRINRHIQDYRYAMQPYIDHRIHLNAIETADPQAKAEWALISEQLQESLRRVVMDINGDCMLLHMLLGAKSDPLGKKLKEMARQAVDVGQQPPQHLLASYGAWLKRHDIEMKEIGVEVRKLWKGIDDPFGQNSSE